MKFLVFLAVVILGVGNVQSFLSTGEAEGVRNVIELVLNPKLDEAAIAIVGKMYEGDSGAQGLLNQTANDHGTQCLTTSILDKFMSCILYNLKDNQENIGKCVKYSAETRFKVFTVSPELVDKMTSGFLKYLRDTLGVNMRGNIQNGWNKIVENIKDAFKEIPENITEQSQN